MYHDPAAAALAFLGLVFLWLAFSAFRSY